MLSAPPKAARTRKESLTFAEKLDMNEISEKVQKLSETPTSNNGGPANVHSFSQVSRGSFVAPSMDSWMEAQKNGEGGKKRVSLSSQPPVPSGPKPQNMYGKLFFYIGAKPIRSEDWKASWVTLIGCTLSGIAHGHDDQTLKFAGSEPDLFSWPVCSSCKVGKADEISKKGDRAKWGFVFSIDCESQQEIDGRREIYFVAESDAIGANWIQAIYDARFFANSKVDDFASDFGRTSLLE